jgi:hypothetical protein
MEALQVERYYVRIIVDITKVLMQHEIFNHIIVILMLVAVVIPDIVAIVDCPSPADPFVEHIVG